MRFDRNSAPGPLRHFPTVVSDYFARERDGFGPLCKSLLMKFTGHRAPTKLVLMLLVSLPATSGLAQTGDSSGNAATNAALTPTALPSVTVTGRLTPPKESLSSDPAADPATVVTVNQADIANMPIMSYGDIYRWLPGFDVANYGQGGLGYGISIRGWDDSQHGHDIATFIDGMPINEVSSLQINGYTDLNPLIPELVKSAEVTYGPFNARYGNFALAGSASFTTLDSPATGVYLSGGSFGTARDLSIYNFSGSNYSAYTALEADTTAGYRDNQWEQRINSFTKLTLPVFSGTLSIRGQVFSSDWGAPGYINRSLVESGALSPTAAVDPTDGGDKTEENLSLNYQQGTAENSFSFNGYFINNFFQRWRDKDTMPVGPGNPSDQFLQNDGRQTTGFNAEKYQQFDLSQSMSADYMIGAGARADFVRANTYTSDDKTITSLVDHETFDQYNPYIYGQFDFKPVEWLKLTAAARYDDFAYSINDWATGLYISPNVGGVSPKLGLSVTPFKGLSLYANYAYGIRSPDATAELLSDPDTGVAKESTEEVGVKYSDPRGIFNLSGDIYEAYVSDELEDNDVTTPINLGKSLRQGFDLDGQVFALKEHGQALSLVADLNMVHARLLDAGTGGNYIPSIPPWIFSYGADWQLPLFSEESPNVATLSVRDQYVGSKELATDGSVEPTSVYSRVSTKLSYTRRNWHNFTTFVDLIIYPDNRLSEAAFVLKGGVVGVSPQAPVTVNAGVSLTF
jgi:outer membrane receptor protein involved in Fe transport